MAGNEKLIIDITADAKAATKEIGALQKDVDKLEKEKPEVEVTADTKAASKAIDGVEKQAHELTTGDFDITVQAKVDGVLSAFDKVVAETKEVAAAADLLGAALGPELSAQADTTAIVQELQKAGLTLDEIGQNADQLGGKLKELADADVGGKLGSSLGTARGKLDEMSDSARGANSALANVVGNSAQDVAALGGIAGTAGVALGQLGEYAADATLGGEKLGSALTSMAKVAGPMAAMALAVQLVGTYMDGIKVEEAFRKGLVDDFTDSIRETGSAIQSMNEKFTETGKIEFVTSGTGIGGLSKSVKDLVPIAAQYDVTVDTFIEASQKGSDAQEEFALAVTKATALYGDGSRSKAARDLIAALDQYGDSTKEATKHAADFNKVNKITTQAAVDAFDAYTKLQDPVGQFPAQFDAMAQAMAHGMNPAARDLEVVTEGLGISIGAVLEIAGQLAAKMNPATKAFADAATGLQKWTDATARGITGLAAFGDALSTQDWGRSTLAGAVTAMSEFTEQQFGLTNIIADTEAAFDNLDKSVEDNGKTFDVTTEKGRANESALQDVARALDTELAAAYKDANGNMDTFNDKAGHIAMVTLGRLQKELGLSDDETAALGKQLGLLPEDIQTRYQLAGDEEAKLKLGLLQTAIDNLPEDVQTTVSQQIVQGDYQGAVSTIQNYYNQHPPQVPVGANTQDFDSDVARAKAKAEKPVNIKVNFNQGSSIVHAAGGIVGAEGGIAGEAGPEFVQRPGRATELLLGPAVMPRGTRVTSVRKTRQILKGRRPKEYASGTPTTATVPVVVTSRSAPMTFIYQQQAPVYGIDDLNRHLAAWSQQIARKISAGRRN